MLCILEFFICLHAFRIVLWTLKIKRRYMVIYEETVFVSELYVTLT